jgi:predicted RecB family endonuclease
MRASVMGEDGQEYTLETDAGSIDGGGVREPAAWARMSWLRPERVLGVRSGGTLRVPRSGRALV